VRQHELARCGAAALLADRDRFAPLVDPRIVAAHKSGDVPPEGTSGVRAGHCSRECQVELLDEGQIERFQWHGGRHASGVERVDRLHQLLELLACEPVAKVRSGFDELGDHDRPTADVVDDVSAPTADWRDDELITGVAELSSRFVIRRDMALAIATHDVDVAARAERVVCLAEGRVTTEERQR